MNNERELVPAHPEGEVQIAGNQPAESGTSLDTFAGKIYVKWAPEATVSRLGLTPFFIEFLMPPGLSDLGNQPAESGTSLDTFAGKIYVKWAPEATVSRLGLMPFFIEFLKTTGLF